MHQVRHEYQEIVDQLEKDLPMCERVSWPHPHFLCFPQHMDSSAPVHQQQVSSLSEIKSSTHSTGYQMNEDGGGELLGKDADLHNQEKRKEEEEEVVLEEHYMKEDSTIDSEEITSPSSPPNDPSSHTCTQDCNGSIHEDSRLTSQSPVVAGNVDSVMMDTSRAVLTCDMSSLTLPDSREELLKLRSQLVMELMWVRQAISSRKQVELVPHTHTLTKCTS